MTVTDTAIVGIDCRFPGAPDPSGLWDLMMGRGDGVTEVPRSRWNADDYYAPEGGRGKANSRDAGFIADADAFDHDFFGFTREEAEITDPQVRLLLECAWRALEDAAVDPRSLAGTRTGVYVGIMGSEWTNLSMTSFGGLTGMTGSGIGYAITANRISYHLDLNGPSVALDAACSSSLVALDAACAALRAGVCDHALVGAANLLLTPATGIYFAQAAVASPDGRCKPFSTDADGIVAAEGVAVVVLRRLEDALADGLPVYAVVKGGAVNHGGRSSTVTAPNPRAQQAVLAEAYERAGVRPRDVAYVETHGTGTVLGDRMEVRSLGKVHRVPRERPCAIGSVKGNIGHAEGASGLAGLIKVALSLHHRVVPPSRFAESENPRLRLAANGLELVKEPMPLPAGPVIAGVSSFGLGGTNAHIVLGSAPEEACRPCPDGGAVGGGVLTVSAPDVAGLRRAVRLLAGDVAARPAGLLAAASWTSNRVKASGPVRFAVPVEDREQALAVLDRAAGDDAVLAGLSGRAGRRPRMGWIVRADDDRNPDRGTDGMYERCPPYRRALDDLDAALRPHLGWSVRDALASRAAPSAVDVDGDGDGEAVAFAAAWTLGRALLDLGVTPAWMAGEGVGEYVVAALAGTLAPDEAWRLAAARDAGAGSAGPARRRADVPVYSGGHGGRLDDEPPGAAFPAATGARFEEALAAAMATDPTHVVELGGGPGGLRLFACPRDGGAPAGEGLPGVVAALYRDGLDPDWDALYDPAVRVRQRLSPYAFAVTGRFWWNRPPGDGDGGDGGGDLAASVARPDRAGGRA
ncbi:beta-ketoacyl synthase N-terminal-like domain-containing protein [Actinomadura sp. LOL_016]|uniref:beta-ketoacyl synthase N-terminal-like domain-containing protein n=1 Tax=Actinomadura sp. LOL_016 TaxID=3345411 RepID=UPI003A8793E9